VPAAASTGPLGVTTSFGIASSTSSFTVTSTAPITITSGGTYSGQWISTNATPAVQINTTAPVTIAYSDVQNLSGGDLIDATNGANVTIIHTTFEGGNGRAFYAYKLKSLTIQNCTITDTSGIRLDGAADSATVEISQNKVRNIQSASYNTVFAQLANVTTAQIDISWNEVINTYGQSGVEDNISIYASAFAQVHDNYIQGAYPSSPSAPFTGSGIMIDYVGAHDNNVYSNQIVDTTNAGIGIAGGWNNKVHDNRMVSDGKLDDGTPLAAANVGLYVWNMYSDPNWGNNDAYGNTVGWLNASGNWAGWWLPDCSGTCSNTSYPGTVNHAAEQAEYQIWLAKLLANGITPGA
jgi:parallel beta-helix repeat protein